jgi:hypothetical protein
MTLFLAVCLAGVGYPLNVYRVLGLGFDIWHIGSRYERTAVLLGVLYYGVGILLYVWRMVTTWPTFSKQL